MPKEGRREKRYQYDSPLEIPAYRRLHWCGALHDNGHKIMAPIFLFPFLSMRIVGMARAWGRPSLLLQNSSLFDVCQRISFVHFVPVVSFPSSILECLVPPKASLSPLVHDCLPELCRWRRGVCTHIELWKVPSQWTCGTWYCNNIPLGVSIWPTPVVVPKHSSEDKLLANCSQSLFVCLFDGGNSCLAIILSLPSETILSRIYWQIVHLDHW